MKRNVLIFHSGALGDFIVTWPLAVALGRLWPHSRIIYVTASQKGRLAQRVIGTEFSDSEIYWHQLFSAGAVVDQSIRPKLADAHHVFSFISDGSDAWSQNVRQIAPEAILTTIQPRPANAFPGHISEFLINQLSSVPPVQSAVAAMVRMLRTRPISPVALKSEYVMIHPGAGGSTKCWPVENYLGLVDRLNQRGNAVRVVLGEVERDRWPASLIAEFDRRTDVRWPADYLELFEMLRSASVFIGNDSGPAHLAGIIGVPSVVLFGNDASLWQPIGRRVEIIGHPLAELSIDQVWQTIQPHVGITEANRIS